MAQTNIPEELRFPIPKTIGEAYDNLVKTMEVISGGTLTDMQRAVTYSAFMAGAAAFYHISCTQSEEGFKGFLEDFVHKLSNLGYQDGPSTKH